jgi:glucokinase
MRIGIDIGGTKIVAGIVDNSGKVTARKKIFVGRHKGYPIVRNAIVQLVRDVLSENTMRPGSLEGIGVQDRLTRNLKKSCFHRTSDGITYL